MFPRRLQRPKSSFFLLGPPWNGKITWARAELPKAHRIDLLEEARYQSYLADPRPTRTLRPADTRGRRAISDLPGLRRRILVYLGPQPLVTQDGIEVWPLAHFARALAEGTLWP